MSAAAPRPAGPAAADARPPAVEARDLSLVFETRDGPVHALSHVE